MSLNHLTSSSINNPWMNINCNTVTCASISTSTQPFAEGTLGTPLSIPDSTVTPITTLTVTAPVGVSYNSGTGVFTATTAGTYSVDFNASWAANATGQRAAHILKNGSAVTYGYSAILASGTIVVSNLVASNVRLTAGQTFTLNVLQSSGGALNLTSCTATIAKL